MCPGSRGQPVSDGGQTNRTGVMANGVSLTPSATLLRNQGLAGMNIQTTDLISFGIRINRFTPLGGRGSTKLQP